VKHPAPVPSLTCCAKLSYGASYVARSFAWALVHSCTGTTCMQNVMHTRT